MNITLCWCGARILNGHHCENGHMQNRDVDMTVIEHTSDAERQAFWYEWYSCIDMHVLVLQRLAREL